MENQIKCFGLIEENKQLKAQIELLKKDLSDALNKEQTQKDLETARAEIKTANKKFFEKYMEQVEKNLGSLPNTKGELIDFLLGIGATTLLG